MISDYNRLVGSYTLVRYNICLLYKEVIDEWDLLHIWVPAEYGIKPVEEFTYCG